MTVLPHTDYGPLPELSLAQRLVLLAHGKVLVRFVDNGYGKLPVYVKNCRVHGLFLDMLRGYDGHFECNDCFIEVKMEAAII